MDRYRLISEQGPVYHVVFQYRDEDVTSGKDDFLGLMVCHTSDVQWAHKVTESLNIVDKMQQSERADVLS